MYWIASDGSNRFCWCITKLSLRRLIVVYRLIDQEFPYQFLCHFWLWTLKTALAKWRMYSINKCGTIDFLPFEKVTSGEQIECLRGRHPEYIFMPASYRFISNLEGVKGKRRCSWNLGKIFTKLLQWNLIFK